MEKVYKSKISIGLATFIGVVMLGCTLPLFFEAEKQWPAIFILVATNLFLIHLFLNTYYIISGHLLTVKSSFIINTKIDIRSIKAVIETNSMMSAPALSLDRLELTYGTFDSVVVSPKEKQAFIDHLLSINEAIKVVRKEAETFKKP